MTSDLSRLPSTIPISRKSLKHWQLNHKVEFMTVFKIHMELAAIVAGERFLWGYSAKYAT
jgi:hypothetical protein